MKIQPVIVFLVILLFLVIFQISNLGMFDLNKEKDFERDTWLKID